MIHPCFLHDSNLSGPFIEMLKNFRICKSKQIFGVIDTGSQNSFLLFFQRFFLQLKQTVTKHLVYDYDYDYDYDYVEVQGLKNFVVIFKF